MSIVLRGYAYDADNNHVVAVIVGKNNAEIEYMYDKIYGACDNIGLTYSPAFGFSRGLIMDKDVPIYDCRNVNDDTGGHHEH